MAIIYAGHTRLSVLATTDIVVEPVALNMRYALAPCVAVSVGGTQMSYARLLRLAGTN